MTELKKLLQNNRRWAEAKRQIDHGFFERLARQQNPAYMWIGCSDSRVPANEIIGLDPGEVFVHRNVANQVIHTDLNCLSAVQYAVDELKVEHIIVTGHYGCGGVHAAMEGQHFGIVDNWIRCIRDTYVEHKDELASLDAQARFDRLCELNVVRQVHQLCHTRIVQQAWARGQKLSVHGWIYRLHDGLLHDLGTSFDHASQIDPIYRISNLTPSD